MTYEEMKLMYAQRKSAAEARHDELEAQADKLRKAADRYARLVALKQEESRKVSYKANAALCSVHWHDLLEELMNKVSELTGIEFEPRDSWGTLGLRCESSVFSVKKEGQPLIYLDFTPGFKDKDSPIYVDTGEHTGNYRQGSIAELNGFNNVSVPVTSVEQIVEMVRKRIDDAV